MNQPKWWLAGSSFIGAEVVKIDVEHDLALLELPYACHQPITKLASEDPMVGSEVYTLRLPKPSMRHGLKGSCQ